MEAELGKLFSTLTVGGAGVWTLVIMVAGYLAREYRENRKLSTEDREAMRSGYAADLLGLRQENRELRSELQQDRHEADERYKLCQQENEQLRKMLVSVRDEVEGLKRRVATDAVELSRLGGRPII